MAKTDFASLFRLSNASEYMKKLSVSRCNRRLTRNADQCNRRLNRKRKYAVFFALFLFGIYLVQTVNIEPRYVFVNSAVNSACVLPDPDPFDESIKQFIWHPDPIECDQYSSLVYVNESGHVTINQSALQQLKIKKFECTYNILHRDAENDDHVTLGESVKLRPPEIINSDFFRVKCRDSYSNTVVFNSLLFSVNSDQTLNRKQILDDSENQMSVFIFGIDAVSRLAGIRKLPKSYDYLVNELGGYVFKGYMKIGDNTFPNIIPLMTGKEAFSAELPEVDFSRDTFDSYPFIWKDFSKRSYATMFAEDYPDIAMFNLGKQGFKKQPTDHYMRPFWRGMKKTDLADVLLDSVLMGFENKKLKLRKKSSLCYGNKPKHVLMIDYFKQFIRRYAGKRRFAFSWLNEISHNYVNFLELADMDILHMLKWLKNEGHLKNSILIFMSDHGSRIDEIRNTFVGRIEERMPMSIMVIPEVLKRKYPRIHETLKNNVQRLTTHYDMHETLRDVLNSNFVGKRFTRTFPRGISLFSNIPKQRTCADAGISEHFCACYNPSKVSVDSSVILNICNFVLRKIHSLLETKMGKCEKLLLHKIHQAYKISPGLKHTGDMEFSHFGTIFLIRNRIKNSGI